MAAADSGVMSSLGYGHSLYTACVAKHIYTKIHEFHPMTTHKHNNDNWENQRHDYAPKTKIAMTTQPRQMNFMPSHVLLLPQQDVTWHKMLRKQFLYNRVAKREEWFPVS